MTAFALPPEGKESRVRPPGQMSTSDMLSESSVAPRPFSAAATPGAVVADPSRTQSIQALVQHLAATCASGAAVSERTSMTKGHIPPPHHVTPIPATTATATVSESIIQAPPPSHEPEPINKSANHDAIVRHFHLRRVLDDDANMTDDDGEFGDGEEEVDPGSPYAQRMIKAAKIHEFRRAKSRRDSRMSSVTHIIPVTKRRLARRLRRVPRLLRALAEALITPFTPTGLISRLRAAVLLLTMLVQCYVIPFLPVYFPKGSAALDGLFISFDIVFVADFLASCNTAYYGKADQLEFSRRKIVARYVKSGWRFWLDLLTSVPVDSIIWFTLRDDTAITQTQLAGYVLAGELHVVVRFFSWAALLKSMWFLRVVRAAKEFWFRVVYTRVSYSLAVVEIVLLLLFVAHYVACLWRFTLQASLPHVAEEAHPWEQYVGDLYYAAQLLQGQGAAARNVRESAFGSVAVLFGYLAIAFIISCVSLILINSQSNTSTYQRKLETVFATMDKMQLPPQLRRRIHQYYNHLWFEHDSIDGDIAKFSHELSRSLGLEVRLFKYMDLVLSVQYWRNSSADFVTQIMLSLDVRAYLPEDYIVRQGEVGDGLFLINRGLCELTSCPAAGPTGDGAPPPRARHTVKAATGAATESGAVNVRRLMAGHSFGELALLMNYRRTADVRAVSYVEMCVLGRACFQKLLVRYREDRREVLRELVLSCMEKSGMRFIAFPWEDMVDRVLQRGAHPSRATSHTQLTPWEAAELIVDLITPDGVADETVRFGFRDFDALSHFQLTPITMADGVDDGMASFRQDHHASLLSSSSSSSSSSSCSSCRTQMDRMAQWQHQTLDRLAALESLVTELARELRHPSR